MARPLKEGFDYFWHSVNARNDPKIGRLRSKFHNDGYATWFILLEIIYDNAPDPVPVDDDTMAYCQAQCDVPPARFQAILTRIFALNLLDLEAYQTGKILTSRVIASTIADVISERDKKREEYRRNSGRNGGETGGETPQGIGIGTVKGKKKGKYGGSFSSSPRYDPNGKYQGAVVTGIPLEEVKDAERVA